MSVSVLYDFYSEEKILMKYAKINGRSVAFNEGDTILTAAQKAGIRIPTLCSHPALEPSGACRVCLVEAKGSGKLLAACTTPITEDMDIETENLRVRETRRAIVELMLARHPFECLYCASNGKCVLQELASNLGIKRSDFPERADSAPLPKAVDDSNPFFLRDPDKCVLCGRCVRVCDSFAQYHAIDFLNRGLETEIQKPAEFGIESMDCKFCGQCVAVCPVGALAEKPALGGGLPSGFIRTKTVCPYCGVGCSVIVETNRHTGRVVNVTSDHADRATLNKGRTCVKGRFGWEFVNSPDRLTTPLIREKDGFRAASWEEALDVAAAGLKRNVGKAGFFCSARCTNEDNYLMQRFAREAMQTNNIDHCAHL